MIQAKEGHQPKGTKMTYEAGMKFGAEAAENAWCDIVEFATTNGSLDLIDAVETEVFTGKPWIDSEEFHVTCATLAAQKLRSGEYPEAEAEFKAKSNYFWDA